MTYIFDFGKFKLICSDSHFSYARKKPTVSVYDKEKNTETKIASFNNREAFEWFWNFVSDKGDAEE